MADGFILLTTLPPIGLVKVLKVLNSVFMQVDVNDNFFKNTVVLRNTERNTLLCVNVEVTGIKTVSCFFCFHVYTLAYIVIS